MLEAADQPEFQHEIALEDRVIVVGDDDDADVAVGHLHHIQTFHVVDLVAHVGIDQDFAVHHSNLAKSVATNAGAADVEAIEVGFIAQFKAQPDRFVNLRQYGAGALKDRWLNWKWAQGLGRKGEVVGLGTDVGSLAICYRRDLFQKAGLPTKRADVSRLWPTWSDCWTSTLKMEDATMPTKIMTTPTWMM